MRTLKSHLLNRMSRDVCVNSLTGTRTHVWLPFNACMCVQQRTCDPPRWRHANTHLVTSRRVDVRWRHMQQNYFIQNLIYISFFLIFKILIAVYTAFLKALVTLNVALSAVAWVFPRNCPFHASNRVNSLAWRAVTQLNNASLSLTQTDSMATDSVVRSEREATT